MVDESRRVRACAEAAKPADLEARLPRAPVGARG